MTLRNDPPEGVRVVVDEEDLTAMEGWVQGPCKCCHATDFPRLFLMSWDCDADRQPGHHMKEATFEFDLNSDLNTLIYLLNVCPLANATLPIARELTYRYDDDPYLPPKCFQSRRNLC